jgi:hypothetical protein
VILGDQDLDSSKAKKARQVAEKYQHLERNKPVRAKDGKKKFIVRAYKDGEEKIVRFGDKDMQHYKNPDGKPGGHGDEKRRENFKARHNCDQKAGNKLTPGWWSCNSSW